MTPCRNGHDKDEPMPNGAPGRQAHGICRRCRHEVNLKYNRSELGRESIRARYEANVSAGLCRRGDGRPLASKLFCRPCLDGRESRQKAHVTAGLCRSGDGRPVVTGRYCRTCIEVMATWRRSRAGRVARREGTQRRRAREVDQLCEHDACLTVGATRLVWRAHPHQCYMCGLRLRRKARRNEADHVEFDHVHPLSRGGLHCFENLMPACGPCNRRKHHRPIADIRPDLAYLDRCCVTSSESVERVAT